MYTHFVCVCCKDLNRISVAKGARRLHEGQGHIEDPLLHCGVRVRLLDRVDASGHRLRQRGLLAHHQHVAQRPHSISHMQDQVVGLLYRNSRVLVHMLRLLSHLLHADRALRVQRTQIHIARALLRGLRLHISLHCQVSAHIRWIVDSIDSFKIVFQHQKQQQQKDIRYFPRSIRTLYSFCTFSAVIRQSPSCFSSSSSQK